MAMNEGWIEQVTRFWFEELQPAAWFTRSDALDATIRERFGALHEEIARTQPQDYSTPEAALAAVIVLDQFSRNMFRGSPRSYATDVLALAISEHAIAHGWDLHIGTNRRAFLYMPFEHAEDSTAQARSVELFTNLGDAQSLDYARRHKDVIDRFGRFPHRNAIIGRPSTEEERVFMQTHPGF